MMELGYQVSAWAGSPRDEHQLLGEVIGCLAAVDILPADYLSAQLSSSVHLNLGDDDRYRARDIWAGAGGALKASFVLQATVAADSFGWTPEPPVVTAIEAAAWRPTDASATSSTP
jgi:hypothetical protein